MKPLLVQAVRVLLVGLALGVVHGIVRGWPTLPPAITATTCSGPVAERPGVRWVTVADARHLWDDPTVTFVDARTTAEYEGGHVTNALAAPLDDAGMVAPAIVTMLRSSRVVVAYCDTTSSCARSSRLASLLAGAGLRDVRVLQGGFHAWEEQSYPAEAGTCRLCP